MYLLCCLPGSPTPKGTEPQLHTSGILPCGKPLAPVSLPHFSCWSILRETLPNSLLTLKAWSRGLSVREDATLSPVGLGACGFVQ